MRELGYIVADRRFNNIKGFVGFTNDYSSVDSTKPVLVIGLKKAKEIIGDKFNILDKKISENVYWTFKKTEKRTDFEADLPLFYQRCLNKAVEGIKYYYINIIKLKYSKIKKLYSILFSKEKKYIYINNDMIYVLYGNCVLGISLLYLRYCGIKSEKILAKIKENKENKIYEEDSPFVRKIKREIGNNEYVIPYFMSIE